MGYVKSDLMIPEELRVADLAGANAKGAAWCAEVNAQVHSEIAAVPAERLELERELFGDLPSLRARIGKVVMRKVDRLSCVRFGSARYSVPKVHIGRQVELRMNDGTVMVVFLGEIIAEHAWSPLVRPLSTMTTTEGRDLPPRAVRPKTPAEKAFCALGPAAEAFIKGAAARGVTTLAPDLDELSALEAAHGKDALIAALERAVAFGRFRATDVLSILDAGTGVPRPERPATHSSSSCPVSPPLARRLRHRGGPMSTTPPPRPRPRGRTAPAAALGHAHLSPELLVTAKTQRWKPEEFLRTLIEAEITSRDSPTPGPG